MLQFFAADFCLAIGIFPQAWPRLNNGVSLDRESLQACASSVKLLIELRTPATTCLA